MNVLEVLRELNPTIKVDDAGRLPFDGQDLQQVVDRFRDENDDVVLPASLGYDEQRSTQAMREGKTLYLRNWPLAYRTLRATSGENSAADERKFAITQLPGGSVLGGQNLAVARHSKRPTAATELITFLTNEPSQRALFVNGGFAATAERVRRPGGPGDRSRRREAAHGRQQRRAPAGGPCARFSKILRDAVTHPCARTPPCRTTSSSSSTRP